MPIHGPHTVCTLPSDRCPGSLSSCMHTELKRQGLRILLARRDDGGFHMSTAGGPTSRRNLARLRNGCEGASPSALEPAAGTGKLTVS